MPPQIFVTCVAIALLIICLIVWKRQARQPRIGEIGRAGDLQKKYGLYAENRPVIKLDPQTVPESLRDLIPVAEKWGIGDDIIRSDFEDKASHTEKDEFVRVLRPRIREVVAWLDTIRSYTPMSDAAEAFMYMCEAFEEVVPYPPKAD